MHVIQCKCRGEDVAYQSQTAYTFYHVGPGARTQVVSLDGKPPNPLSHLASPVMLFNNGTNSSLGSSHTRMSLEKGYFGMWP